MGLHLLTTIFWGVVRFQDEMLIDNIYVWISSSRPHITQEHDLTRNFWKEKATYLLLSLSRDE